MLSAGEEGILNMGRKTRRASRLTAVIAGLGALVAFSEARADEETRTLYERSCALCHGKDGTPPPLFAKKGTRAFTDAAWQKERSDEQIEKAIRKGVPKTLMASFEDALSADEIARLVRYVRSLGPAK
jgi:mono/diheme cytochrome c family protein